MDIFSYVIRKKCFLFIRVYLIAYVFDTLLKE